MIERKIQGVGAGSFAVSLPKHWVIKSRLKKNSPIFLNELGDGSIALFPSKPELKKTLANFSIKTEEHLSTLGQVMYGAYYLGAENITVFSEKPISDENRVVAKEVLRHMSGAEIVFEDEKKIVLKVFLDKEKVDANNVLSRIGLIIQSSLNMCLGSLNVKEIERNEFEVDRLFHLATKIILLASNDYTILQTSGIKNNSFILSYFLISKKMENIADEIEHIAMSINKSKFDAQKISKLLSGVKIFIQENVKFPVEFLGRTHALPTKHEKQKIDEEILAIQEPAIRISLRSIFRLLYDVQEEMVNLQFYDRLVKEKIL
ncbi:MAG: PhoU domain-containing protein [archaeon]